MCLKKSIPGWQIAGFLFTSVVGTLLHFLFEWTGENTVVGLFSAVNESIWEHMKLVYVPMFFFALIQKRFADDGNFWCVKLMGMVTALALIPGLYYTYTGALGISADWFNIAIFFLAAGAAYYLENILFQRMIACPVKPAIAFGTLILIGVLFGIFTFYPPHIPLFANPGTGKFGI